MGNRSKAEWMSCFARSPVLNGFQGWVSLRMCCLAGSLYVCAHDRERESESELERVYMCIMHVHANLCVPACLCACVPESFPLCLGFDH